MARLDEDPPSTRVMRPPALERAVTMAERVALFAYVLHRSGAMELLGGLAEPLRRRACEHATRVAGWDSPTRQARVAVEFGIHPDCGNRLRTLMSEAPASLQKEVFRLLPPYHRTCFREQTQLSPAPGDAPPASVTALAERLIRESTR